MNLKIDDYLNKVQLDNKKLILIGLICVIVIYIDYSFVLGPQVSAVNSARNKIKKISADLNAFEQESSGEPSLNGADRSGVLKKELIAQDELPRLLEEISQAANKNNVRIMQIAPVKEAKQASAAGPKAMIIKLELISRYHDLGSFVNDLENSSKFLMLTGLKIKREPADTTKENVSLELKTYANK